MWLGGCFKVLVADFLVRREVGYRRFEEGIATEGGGSGQKQSRFSESESRMYIHYHLFPAKEGIADEFAGAQRDGLLSVGHGYILGSYVSY